MALAPAVIICWPSDNMVQRVTDDQERQLRIELMTVQIDLYRKQAWWEALKAVAILLSATAGWAALILTVAHFIK